MNSDIVELMLGVCVLSAMLDLLIQDRAAAFSFRAVCSSAIVLCTLKAATALLR